MRLRPRIRTAVAVLVAAPWLIWAVVRVFGLESGRLLVPAVAFTPYVAATALVPVVVALALRQRVVAGLATVALVALAVTVIPRMVSGGDGFEGSGGEVLTVMSANLGGGGADARDLMRQVGRDRVDLLALQELTPEALRRLDAAGARERFPHRVVDPRRGARGSGLLSRHPLSDRRRTRGSRLSMPQARVMVPRARRLDVQVVHAAPPLGDDIGAWRRDLRGLPRPSRAFDPLRMLIGDFNATMDHREFRRLLDAGYQDAADSLGAGLRTTYRAGRFFPPPIAIDHLLFDERVGASTFETRKLRGSDHRGFVADLRIPN